jgi:protein TonB
LNIAIHNSKFDGNGIFWAITASILLHVLVAVVVPNFNFSPQEKKRQVLKIALQKPTPPPAPIVEPLPPVKIPEPVKPKPKPVKKKPVVKPKPIKKKAPEPVKQPEVTPPPPVVEEVIAVQPVAESEPEVVIPQPPPPIEPPPPPEPTQAAVDNALSAYSSLLGKSIAKHKSYPKIAQRRGWEGTVFVNIKIDSDGNVLSAEIKKSSGHNALDKRALKMVNKAAPFPPPPKALQGRSFNISVPVTFKLAKG